MESNKRGGENVGTTYLHDEIKMKPFNFDMEGEKSSSNMTFIKLKV